MNEEQLISTLELGAREDKIKALQWIFAHPNEKFRPILSKIAKTESDSFVIASLVKTLARVYGKKAINYVLQNLKHTDGRIRANCIEALEYCGNCEKETSLQKLLLNFLADPEPRVVTTCIKQLSAHLDEKAINELIELYCVTNDEDRLRNILYLIEKLKPSSGFFILEQTLNHPNANLRTKAHKLIGLYQKPELGELREPAVQISAEPINTNNPKNKITDFKALELEKAFRTHGVRDLLALLKELNSLSAVSDELLFIIRQNMKADMNPFILATCIKTIGLFSRDDEWGQLSPFLHHPDQRVADNTVEVLSNRKDPHIPEYLAQIINSGELIDEQKLRTICSGMDFLLSYDSEMAVSAMQKFALGNLNARAAFGSSLKFFTFPKAKIQTIIFQLLQNAQTREVFLCCLEWLRLYGDENAHSELIKIISQDQQNKKNTELLNLQESLEQRFNLNPTKLSVSSESENTCLNRLSAFASQKLKEKNWLKLKEKYFFDPTNLNVKSSIRIAGTSFFIVFLLFSGGFYWFGLKKTPGRITKPLNNTVDSHEGSKKTKRVIYDLIGELTYTEPTQALVRIKRKGGEEFEVRFSDNWKLDQFKRGELVRVIGSLEHAGLMATELNGLGIFPSRRFGDKNQR